MWPEIEQAQLENRHELILSGKEIAQRIQSNKDLLDESLFNLTSLNYLNITDAKLSTLPAEIARLNLLQTLVLHSNNLLVIPETIAVLTKLKNLDLSRNKLSTIPDVFEGLKQLTTLNISQNSLEEFPKLRLAKLNVLDLSGNKLDKFPDICHVDLSALNDLKLNGNCIEVIPGEINKLVALKNFDISANKIKVVPLQLAECHKLKDLNLKTNPVADRRLFKLIDQCRTKQVLDYVLQHCKRAADTDSTSGDVTPVTVALATVSLANTDPTSQPPVSTKYQVIVEHYGNNTLSNFDVVREESVKAVRGHILGCVIGGFQFKDDEMFKKFIQLQTKLHNDVCQKRNAATIATHDLKKLGNDGNLTYTVLPRDELLIKPLNGNAKLSGSRLVAKLQKEAEALRKEKKRTVYSGIHKYLYLVEGQKLYPCLLNAKREVISFPPITNSDITKMSADSVSMFVEVTSNTSLVTCKQVLDSLVRECVVLFDSPLTVYQVKVTDSEGNLKSVYPAKDDLNYDANFSISVTRNK